MANGLKSVVLDTTMNTEVRIGSYLAALHCANTGYLQEVVNQMSSESNTQGENTFIIYFTMEKLSIYINSAYLTFYLII